MDLALKGLESCDARWAPITCASPHWARRISDVTYLDPYGRKWQERAWAVPDSWTSYVTALLLPTPDGYAGMVEYLSIYRSP